MSLLLRRANLEVQLHVAATLGLSDLDFAVQSDLLAEPTQPIFSFFFVVRETTAATLGSACLRTCMSVGV